MKGLMSPKQEALLASMADTGDPVEAARKMGKATWGAGVGGYLGGLKEALKANMYRKDLNYNPEQVLGLAAAGLVGGAPGGYYGPGEAVGTLRNVKIPGMKSPPKNSVLSVSVHNRNLANKVAGSGEAYLDSFGNVILDGNVYPVSGKAYLHENKFYKTPPDKLMEQVKNSVSAASGYTKNLKEVMRQIDWKQPKEILIKEGQRFDGLFGSEIADVDFYAINAKRYRNVPDNKRYFIQQVERFVDGPDEKKLMDALYRDRLDENAFEVGGILHLDKEQQLSQVQKDAIKRYHERGGRLGLSAVKAIEDPAITESYARAYPKSMPRLTSKPKRYLKGLPKGFGSKQGEI